DAYKLSNGKTYVSDAGAIRSWVAERVNCEPRTSKKNGDGTKINFKGEWKMVLDAIRKQRTDGLPLVVLDVVGALRGMSEIGRMNRQDGFYRYMEKRKELLNI
ncbi:unnamed protein product, partial [marine sediment metagenome]